MFMFNPPTHTKRRTPTRKRRTTKTQKKRPAKSASKWREMVKKYGVAGAAKRRATAKAAAAKRKRTIASKTRKKVITRKKRVIKVRRNPMAKRRKTRKRRVTAKRNPVKRKRRVARRKTTTRKRRSTYRKNSWGGSPRRHSKAAKLGWSRRRHKTTSKKKVVRRRKRKSAKSYSHRRYLKRRGPIKRQSRKALTARRKNVRKALNKRYGVRKWRKSSTAKWNPGTALSLGGFTRSIRQTFSVAMLKDGAAVAGGIIGALALPAVIQRVLPTAITSRVSLTSGWTGYAANFASAGIVGYLGSLALGASTGRKMLYGGLGAAMAKLILDKVPMVASRTGVSLGGNSDLDRLVEQEIAAELATGADLGAYLSPGNVAQSQALGDYLGPTSVAAAVPLGAYMYPEFGEYEPATGIEF